MNKKKTDIKILIIVEAIFFYFCILNVISHVKAPMQYIVDADSLLLQAEDFAPLSAAGGEKIENKLSFVNIVQGTAVGYVADLQLTNLEWISASFQIDCPNEFAGGTIFVDLCNGEQGYDNPEQEQSFKLEAGINTLSCQIYKGDIAPSKAQLRIITLDRANFMVEQLKVEKAFPAPSVTSPMIWVVIFSGIILAVTIITYWRKYHIHTQVHNG